ncbi:MAG: TonB-dependent receptor [Bacteroidales bacterium]|nr:MAG: TonB-dependent receptor [Bacteroidales bacterium]
MKNGFLILSLAFVFLFDSGYGQTKVTLSGYLKDKKNGEMLIGATVYVKELNTGTTSNVYGFYSLSLPQGSYNLTFSYIGYTSRDESIDLQSNITLDVELESQSIEIEAVVITSKKRDENLTRSQTSMIKMDPKAIRSLPILMGESDILKSIQMMPGVQSVSEGSSGFSVRGGSADHNLLLLDEAPIFNAGHLMGFFSVFNSDAIKDATLYKGDIPASNGGRLSSLLDIRMKDGNKKEFKGEGGIGIIASRLTLEGPLKKDKGSFIVSARRTYADMFLALSPDTGIRNNKLYFFDLNTKLNYEINSKNRLFLSGYFGRDVYGFGNDFKMSWGNATVTARWNHLFSSKLFSNLTFIYSNYNYDLGFNKTKPKFDWTSSLNNFGLKYDFTYYHSTKSTLRYGVQSTVQDIQPGKFSVKGENSEYKVPNNKMLEYAAYFQHEQKFWDKLSVNYGLRLSMFQNIGKATVYRLENFKVVDTITYNKNKIFNTYIGLEPRFSASYMLNQSSSVKASYSRTRQYVQLASNSIGGSPLDVWFPASQYVKPQVSDQVGIGYFRNLSDNKYEFSVESFYKWMNNQIDFDDNADLVLNNQLEKELRFGKAHSYGLELLFKKNEGRFTGWVSYTFSRALRKFPDINDGKQYNANYDKPHNLTIALNYNITNRVILSANWVYTSGAPITYPTMRFPHGNANLPIYGDKNANRLPDYHRLDLAMTIKNRVRAGRRWQGEWNFSVYNAYNYANAYSVYFETDKKDKDKIRAYKMIMFRIVPSVTYNFKF